VTSFVGEACVAPSGETGSTGNSIRSDALSGNNVGDKCARCNWVDCNTKLLTRNIYFIAAFWLFYFILHVRTLLLGAKITAATWCKKTGGGFKARVQNDFT